MPRSLDADELTGALRSIAAKDLPQTVEYLIRDVARRHGRLNVRAAATVIATDDEALLTEVLA